MSSNSKRPQRRKQKSARNYAPYQRKSQFDRLEPRKLLTVVQTYDPVESSNEDALQLIVISTDFSSGASTENTSIESTSETTSEFDSDEGLGWAEGSGFVPGSVLASADQIDWSTTEETTAWDDTGFGSSSSFCSGSGGAGESGSGGGDLSGSGSGGSSGSGSGGSAGSGSGGSAGSGSGGSSGSGSGGSSGSGSGGSSGSGSGSSSGNGSGGSSGSGSGSSSGSGSGGSSGSGSGGSSGSGSGGASGSGSGEPTNSAPVIHDFAQSSGDGYYVFTGYVSDNVDPAGLTIYFGGLLSGEYTTVASDGTFSFQIQLTDPFGEVTSVTQDGEGLWSETAYVEI